MNLDLDLFRLQVFVAVVDEGGHSAAARRLHLAQSTVSRHVTELQRSCEATLIDYDGRRIRLTAAGRVVYQAATAMLAERTHLARTLGDLEHGRSGRVRVGVSMALEQPAFLQQVIAPFCRDHDGILLSVRFGHSRPLAQAVLDHEADLAYVLRTDLPGDAPFEPIAQAALAFLVAANHPLAALDSVDIDQVREAGVITAPLGSPEAYANRALLRRQGIGDADIRIEVDGQQARIMTALSGLGVLATFTTRAAGGASAAGPGLVRLPVRTAAVTVPIGLVAQPEGVRTADTALLAAWLRAHAG